MNRLAARCQLSSGNSSPAQSESICLRVLMILKEVRPAVHNDVIRGNAHLEPARRAVLDALRVGVGEPVKPLVRRANPGAPLIVALLLKRAVNQEIRRGKQQLHPREMAAQHIGVEVAGEDQDREMSPMRPLGDIGKPLRLQERLSADERDALDIVALLIRSSTRMRSPVSTMHASRIGCMSGLQQPGQRRRQPCTQSAMRRPGPSASVSGDIPARLR